MLHINDTKALSECIAYNRFLGDPANSPLAFEDWKHDFAKPRLLHVSTNPATLLAMGTVSTKENS